MSDWKTERRIEVNPSWIIQLIIGSLIGMAAWSVNGKLDVLTEDIAELKAENRQFRQENIELRAQLSALELGLRGDRFSMTDWRREYAAIDERLKRIEQR